MVLEETSPRGEQTRQEIISAAFHLFMQSGYHGTSMRKIARQAGIALGGIYNHFASKEEIFVAVLEAYHPYHEILPAIQNASSETLEGFVREAGDNLVMALSHRPDFLNLMLIEIVEFKSQHIALLFDQIFPNFASIVQAFITRSDSLRAIPVPIIIRAFLGVFFSFYITQALLGNRHIPGLEENAFDYFVDIFLHGISNSPDLNPGRANA